MAFDVKVETKEDIAYVKTSGIYDHEKSKSSFYDVLEVCIEKQLHRIFVDHSEQIGEPNFIQRLDYTIFIVSALEQYSRKNLENIRIVYLGPVGNKKSMQQTEKLIKKSGVHLWSTTDRKAALQWLIS